MSEIEFSLNGKQVAMEPRPGETLMDALRGRFGVLSVKDGCKPQGQCGCCLALVDGVARVTCAWAAEKAAGKQIVTLEGVPEADRDLLARAFLVAAGLQCGFCIPGIALRAKALVDKNPSPSRDEIAKAIDGNLCRCTGYVKVIDAVEMYARGKRGEAVPEPCADGHVGKSLARYEGAEMTLGVRPYVGDLVREGLLHGAVKLSDHPRALVKRIDTSKARALPGVVRVATAADVPGKRWYGLIENDWPGFVAEGEEVRCVGDVLAAVAAEDEHTAREAARLVEVEYEVREPVLDPDAGLREGAPQVNPAYPNVLSRTAFARGDTDAALAASAHVVRGTWQTQRIEHLFLEPESALCEPKQGGGLHLYTQGQGIFDDQRQVSAFLGIDEKDLFVELVPCGGAFGGQGGHVDPVADGAARKLTGRPVRITLSREESIRLHPKRHPIRMNYEVGCDARGPPDGGARADGGRHRRLRLGWREGARARGGALVRSVSRPERGRRGAGGCDEQPAVRRHARLRREPGVVRHRGRAGPAGGQGRHRRLGDALAQRRRGRRHVQLRADLRKVRRRRSARSRP